MTDEQRKLRQMTKHIKEALYRGYLAMDALDKEMLKPSSVEGRRNIGRIATALYIAFDLLAHFGLGYSFKKISKMKKS